QVYAWGQDSLNVSIDIKLKRKEGSNQACSQAAWTARPRRTFTTCRSSAFPTP
ncbi:unnamed protein product, partial [Laminaria digitata]